MAITGRPREFDRGAALEAAMLAFWRKGFAATSMNDLCDVMDIRLQSLYAAFGSKEALYLEAVEHYVQTIGPPYWTSLRKGRPLVPALKTFCCGDRDVAGILRDTGRLHGDACGPRRRWPAAITEAVRKVRLEVLGKLQSRLKSGVAKANCRPRRTSMA